MRALTRIRQLAVALTLLLFLATTALAYVPKPIDRPDGPPEPSPTEIGDPDMGGNLTRERIWSLVIAAQLSNPMFRRFALPFRASTAVRSGRPTRASRVR